MSLGRSKTPQVDTLGLWTSRSSGGAQDPPMPDVVFSGAAPSAVWFAW